MGVALRYSLSFILFFQVLCASANFYAISGYVLDGNNDPIPYTRIFVKNTSYTTTADINGRYYLELREGSYEVVYSMLGFSDHVLNVTLTDNIVQNVWLEESIEALDEVLVKVSRRDPSYEIIKNCIERKDYFLNQINGISSDFYIKATEIREADSAGISTKNRKKDDEEDGEAAATTNMNLVEVSGELHLQEGKMKEIVNGYSKKGKEDELFFLSHSEADFNFYRNLIYTKLTEAPLVSPLNWTALVAYKFELLSSYKIGTKLIYAIKVIPRKSGNALFEGEIHVVDKDWAIHKLTLSVPKKAMNFYNEFTITQEYQVLQDSVYTWSKQQFEYSTKSGNTTFSGKTMVRYENIQINPVFEKRFFGNEVGVKTQDAYEKDSTYWDITRPEPLTDEEQRHIAYVDSVEGVRNSDGYKDSIETEKNKIKLKNILWFGQDHSNWRKMKYMYFAPVANMFDPVSPGGFRVGYYLTYYKKFDKSKRHFLVVPNATYGIRNEDLKGSVRWRWMYDPYHLRQFYGSFGRNFNLINPYDAYINMFRRSNFYEQDYAAVGHRMELVNGLYLNTSGEFANRKTIADYKFGDVSDQIFENNTPFDFTPYKAFSTTIGADYTPAQQYMREPNEKIVLGSRWPTFSVDYTQGYNFLLGSSVKYSLLQFGVTREHKLGVFGTSRWNAGAGKFLDTTFLQAVDYKYQRQGDPFLYTNPYTTFQLMQKTFPTFDWYVDWHHLHRFNGVIMNKFPLLRKLGLRLVAGDAMLYSFENNYRHVEVFAGAERVFRFWRERFRIGVYYAVSESTDGFNNGIKFSIEYFDKQSQQWNF